MGRSAGESSTLTPDDANPAIGAPSKLLDRREELTPMLAQYLSLCEQYSEALVLFQVGDFYEAFCKAAATVAQQCEVALTKREDSTGTYRMAGIPVDEAASYIEALLSAEYRVAVADQVEDASESTGLVDRAVTNVITPGTVINEALLDGASATYLSAVIGAQESEAVSVASVDVTTGECRVTSVESDAVQAELHRLSPAEVLIDPSTQTALGITETTIGFDTVLNTFEQDNYDTTTCTDILSQYCDSPAEALPQRISRIAVAALLSYAEFTQGGNGPLEYVSQIVRYDPDTSLELDAAALRSLEVFEPRAETGKTLLETVDRNKSPLGRRRLEAWLRRPEIDDERIAARHEAVEELCRHPLLREQLRDILDHVYDLERLITRIVRERASARDLRSLHQTLATAPELRRYLSEFESERLQSLRRSLESVEDICELIDAAIVEDPPQQITDGGVIAEGYSEELDELREITSTGREWIEQLEQHEREQTGIESLEVGYNQVHGYYIEVTNPNLDAVPTHYTRRQTLKNAERFYTPALKEREEEILSAQERSEAIEYNLFCAVRKRIGESATRIQGVADVIAQVDALAGFATLAVEENHHRPVMGADSLEITAGRHPVVESAQESFVPNGISMGEHRIAVITGPNMSGKSTYMRQTALIVLLAQAGGFVPATEAKLPIFDRLFTRIGASDDIAGGESTFMKEMNELSEILHAASVDSLILLDEVGRGTSTADGRAIAQATIDFIARDIEATTLFATHYHGITTLANDYQQVCNLHFTVDRHAHSTADDTVTFLYSVESGAASASYGLDVAALAGIPTDVLKSAERYLSETGQEHSNQSRERASQTDSECIKSNTLPNDAEADAAHTKATHTQQSRAVLQDLRELNIGQMTPLEALNKLDEIRQRLSE
ncbi:MAG: DNA mismatch repair protein MutS [Haloquadratum sp. J07HQX50]|nr:MAG: DNA mismatch repair protein MutS [Haloquadratum sp. J07HQX50]